jgi:hypothetical protein
MDTNDQVVTAPKTSSSITIEQLAYLESFDAVIDKDYAFVVYKETKTDSGKWVIRIKGLATAGAVLDPDSSAFKTAIKKAVGHDETHFVWGFNLQPKQGDPRLVENRVMLGSDGKPFALEVHLVTRKADSSAREEQIATTVWPECD